MIFRPRVLDYESRVRSLAADIGHKLRKVYCSVIESVMKIVNSVIVVEMISANLSPQIVNESANIP